MGPMALTESASNLSDPVGDADWVRGDPAAPVTLVEYGEFECPDCGRAYHVIKNVLDANERVRFVFRHFARDDVHPFSERSAQAAEAAGAQGRFWEMHDFLFERQHQLEYDDLFRHAAELGLDVDRFRQDLSNHAFLSKVHANLDSGLASGVSSTPTLFINGERYAGPVDATNLSEALSQAAGDS